MLRAVDLSCWRAMPDSAAQLSFVFVLYRNYLDFDAFLSRQNVIPDNVNLVIVDNTEHDALDRTFLKKWRDAYNVIDLVAEPENLGYLGAAEFATSKLRCVRESEFVAVCNTDLDFRVDEYASIVREKWMCTSDVGVLAPRLVSE